MPANSLRRRVAAFVLAALTLALALPVPARLGPTSHGFDLCVAGKLVPAAPAGSTSTIHDCDRCCGSAPAAVGSGPLAPPRIALAFEHPVPSSAASATSRPDLPYARAPPPAS